jgi:putative nucleotidyltransferase with HDIG domain
MKKEPSVMRVRPGWSSYLVGAGSYVISRKKQAVLEAILGTCLGVTLCDRLANIGGLIHLILPEPSDLAKPWQPEKYAATGLPLFITALRDAGASTERMQACIAGGALIDPLCDADFIFDIGGRIFEIVENILHMERISIVNAETGGFFTCRLSLNLQTWESRIEPTDIGPALPDTIELKSPGPDGLDRAIEGVRPIPQVALKIIRMINEPGHGLREIAENVRTDQVLSARVLRLCNSAFIGLRKKVDSIEQALIMIGEKQILRMAVLISIEKFFSDSGRGYSLCKGGLYYHALGTAMVAELLANFTGKASPGTAYTAGLLHDIGKVVLDQYMAPAFPFFYRRTHSDGAALTDVEHEMLGLDHTDAGRKLAERWSLTQNLIDTISRHHKPVLEVAGSHLTHLVYLADLIMSRFMVGQELERLDTNGLSLRMQTAGINPDQLPCIIGRIPLELFHQPGNLPDLPHQL